MKPLHQVNISTGKDSLAAAPVATCPRCDNTGFKDYAGFAMDLCECRMPAPAFPADTGQQHPTAEQDQGKGRPIDP